MSVVRTHRTRPTPRARPGSGGVWRAWLPGWLGLAALATVNGATRQLYVGALGDLTAHQVSTGALIVVSGGYIWWLHRRRPFPSTGVGLEVGAAWTGMTLAFELLAGHYLFGNAWADLLADYNVLDGRVWVLVPLWTLVAPALVHRLQSASR